MDSEQHSSHQIKQAFTVNQLCTSHLPQELLCRCPMPIPCPPCNAALSVFLLRYAAPSTTAAAPKCVLLPVPFCSDSERVKVLPGEKEQERERERERERRTTDEKEAAAAVKTRQ